MFTDLLVVVSLASVFYWSPLELEFARYVDCKGTWLSRLGLTSFLVFSSPRFCHFSLVGWVAPEYLGYGHVVRARQKLL